MIIDREEVQQYAQQNGFSLMQARDYLLRVKMVEAVSKAKSFEELKPVLVELINRII